MDEQGLTKQDLATRSGVSISFLSDLTNGKANPSLKIMENIAAALNTSLPYLLEHTDMDPQSLAMLNAKSAAETASLPQGYERITAVVTEFQAFQVREWAEAARIRLQKK